MEAAESKKTLSWAYTFSNEIWVGDEWNCIR